ncbi:MAG: response regulator transcription factor [Chloroflexota bacterium]
MMPCPEAGEGDTPIVLIADDEAPIGELVALVVQEAGYASVLARDGRQALEKARSQWPALVIADLMMPHLSGVEPIAALREEESRTGRRPVPVILITAAGGQRAHSAGADVVLRKPFDLDELEATVHRLLAATVHRHDRGGGDTSA